MLAVHPTSAIQDRSVYEDAEVFAKNLYNQGLLNQRDYGAYCELYQVLTEFLPPPDLVVYLRASTPTLLQRIAKRGRDYEQEIAPSYLSQLENLYEEWIRNFSYCPVLTVPCDDLDFVAYSKHLDLIVLKIQEKLTGKDEVVFKLQEMGTTI